MQGILIDVAAREVRAVEYADLTGLHELVGGYIAIAHGWDSGDVLFVDDEGMFKPKPGSFRIENVEQPLAGNGVIVGRERYNRKGDYLGTAPPALTVEQVGKLVRFLRD